MHSIFADLTKPAENRIQFFADSQKKHSISRVLRHSTIGTEGLQTILKGAKMKKEAEASRFNLEIDSLSKLHRVN